MYSAIKLFIRSLGIAGIVLVFVNTAALSLAMAVQGLGQGWQVHMKQGAFLLNGQPIGLQLDSPAAYGLFTLAFVAAFVHHFRKAQTNFDTTG